MENNKGNENKIWAMNLSLVGLKSKLSGENSSLLNKKLQDYIIKKPNLAIAVGDVIVAYNETAIEETGILVEIKEEETNYILTINWLTELRAILTMELRNLFNYETELTEIKLNVPHKRREFFADEKQYCESILMQLLNKIAREESGSVDNELYHEDKILMSVDPLAIDFSDMIEEESGLLLEKTQFEEEALIAAETAVKISPLEDPGGEVELFYGTNRNRTGKTDVNDYYNEDRDNSKGLKLGFCKVTIPKGHIQGEIERPKWYKLEFKENPDKHVTIKSVKETTKDEFVQKLNSELSGEKEKSALVFIHGYKNSFDNAARQAAQLAWDLPFDGLTGFFSWPAATKLRGYQHDEANAEWSYIHLAEFIRLLLDKTEIENLHLLAHSMGNKVLGFTLEKLSTDKNYSEKLKKIHQIVLGAPDIDKGVFETQILPAIKDIGKRRTLYASDKDLALDISEYIRMGIPRLGDAGKDLFVSENIDTIDATNVKNDITGHSYIFETKEVLSDLYHLLTNNLSPKDRRLKARKSSNKNLLYWLFPE